MKEKSNSIHAGHRSRLKARFLRDGLDGFEEHNVVELLLFYGIPFKDTNEIAHRLLLRFGSIAGICDAPIEELVTIDGVGENVATLLKLIPAVSKLYLGQQLEDCGRYNNIQKLGEMLTRQYIGVDREIVLLTLLDNSYNLIAIKKVFDGSVNSAQISARRILELALHPKASMAVLSHNHPGGIAVPSIEDLETTASMVRLFDSISTPLLEHVLVAGKSYTPILYNQLGERRVLPDTSLLSARIDLRAFYGIAEEQ